MLASTSHTSISSEKNGLPKKITVVQKTSKTGIALSVPSGGQHPLMLLKHVCCGFCLKAPLRAMHSGCIGVVLVCTMACGLLLVGGRLVASVVATTCDFNGSLTRPV